MKHLNFEVKRNLHRAPRVYVRSTSSGVVYGAFASDKPEEFNAWSKLTHDETIELVQYIANLTAVLNHLGADFLNEQADYRLRLPVQLSSAINAITAICKEEAVSCDIFSPILSGIIQELKIATAKLSGESKIKALKILDGIGLAEYKKVDWTQTVKSVFSEVVALHDKSEKLHNYAKLLFEKDKSYSPVSIQKMALGEIVPSKWLVCCAIALLMDEKKTILHRMMNDNDIFMLFAKQLLDNNREKELMGLVEKHNLTFLINRIKNYSPKQNEH